MADARYDAVADFYATGFDSLTDSVSQALLNMLEPVAGLHVLDVACGHGRITRELARRGAQVVGLDISGMLVERAREIERSDRLGISYRHADVTAPQALGRNEFDLVACSYGLSDIDDLDVAVAAIAGALRPGGRFVFSILHAVFRRRGRHRRVLAEFRYLLRRGPLDGPGVAIHAETSGWRKSPDAIDVPEHPEAPQPVA